MKTYNEELTYCLDCDRCLYGEECPRAITDDVIEAAKAWWGSPHVHIKVTVDTLHCFEEKKDGE